MGGCLTLLKYLLFIFNIFFWICGLAGTALAIWMLVDPTFSFSLAQESTDYVLSVVITLVASILLVIVATIGICGICKESQCLLLTFFSLLLIIFVAELAAALWGYINREGLEDQIMKAVKKTVQEEYGENTNRQELFDTFQRKLHCCGAEKPEDWMGNKHINVTISTTSTHYRIPHSCCMEHVSSEECELATNAHKVGEPINYKVVYKHGCYTLIKNKLKENLFIIAIIAIVVGSVEILALLFSFILAFAIARSKRYKA